MLVLPHRRLLFLFGLAALLMLALLLVLATHPGIFEHVAFIHRHAPTAIINRWHSPLASADVVNHWH